METPANSRIVCTLAVCSCFVALSLIGSGCGQKNGPVGDSPVVYDLQARAEYVLQSGTWRSLDLGSFDSEAFLAGGWGPPEKMIDGTMSRWMTEKVAGVDLFLTEPADLTLKISCLPYTRSYAGQALTVLVNGDAIGKQPIERSSSLSEYIFQIPLSACVRGNNLIEFRARYASRRHNKAIRLARLEIEGVPESPAGEPCVEQMEDALSQKPGTRVAWHIVAPCDGYVRIQPLFETESPGNECRVAFCENGERHEIGTFTQSRQEPQLLPLSSWPGTRGRIEFEVLGTSAVRWKGAVVGGRIDPKDVNIFFFTIDTLREDHVGAYGYQRDTTPCLDGLADRGTIFLNTFVSSNLSAPSHACMLTARYPQSHGLFANGREMDSQQLTVSQLFTKEGYETAIYSNFPLLHRGDMTGKGFETREYIAGTADTPDVSGKERNVYSEALKWVKAKRREKMFLMVHSEYLHLMHIPDPYRTMFWKKPSSTEGKSFYPIVSEKKRSEIRQKYNRERIDLSEEELQSVVDYYDGALRLTDDCIAAFMEVISFYGLDKYTAIVVTSDHGVSLGQNHRISHTGAPFDHLLKVPLIFVFPGLDQETGGRVEGIVESIDIAPTMLSYAGISVPRRMQGIDLLPWMVTDGRPVSEVKNYAFASLKGYARWYSIRTEGWRYSVNLEEREYLEKDPRSDAQPVSVVKDFPEKRDELRDKLFHWVNTTPDVTARTDKHLPPEIIEMLRKAGYLDDIQ